MKFLLAGIDTLECAYYLANSANSDFFESIGQIKELLRESKVRNPEPATFGDLKFLVEPFGSSSGYPFILSNKEYRVQCGEFNNPSFHVKFTSEALWKYTASDLHDKFLAWAGSVGFEPYKSEGISRVDFSFDYQIQDIDFDENSFVTMSSKDSIHRENNKIQTFTFGKGDIVLRIYDKVAEIKQNSHKDWFFDLWGVKENVWRIEWQVRKETLKRFGIRKFEDLKKKKKSLLKWLSSEHDTLRIPSADSNKSRWPLHPLWLDVQKHIEEMPEAETGNTVDDEAALRSREQRIIISVYGYLKRLAAIRSLTSKERNQKLDKTLERMGNLVKRIHDPLSWELDVEKRTTEMELGKW